MRRILVLLSCAAGGYLLGTFPSADIASRLARTQNLRDAGTQNPGAANALEVLGKPWAVGIAVGDVAKGYLAGLLGQRLGGVSGANLAATSAVVGHCYPAHRGFRGGKGVATSVGQVIATQPAYLPVDAAAAAAAAALVTSPHKARKSMTISSAVWVAATGLWYARRWPNPAAPPIHLSHVAAAFTSSAVVITRFIQEEDS
jgi:acyl phosphate:glycerol-3-phosphate acyltransferase